MSEAEVRSVFEALTKEAPTFHLPAVVAAHTRSYLNSNKENASDKALIFNGFVAMHPGARCFVRWRVDLGPEERRNLATLLGSLNYLGRSESWVEARLTNSLESGIAWTPWTGSENAPEPHVVRVACPVPISEYRPKKPSWLDALVYSSGVPLKVANLFISPV